MKPTDEIAEEQFVVDRAYERLDAMTEHAQGFANRAMAEGWNAGPERDAIVETGLRRVKHLSIGDEPLVFGRIDNQDESTHHIGRVAVFDVEHEPLVTDWRAPAAEPFYRATPREPLGVVRRRHISIKDRKVVHLEDELLDASDGLSDELVLVGEAALLNALRRERTGRMRDIVETIQREQDEIIRAPLEGVVVVQGGPGTGKTAVALHRAAYLLYAHRERLERLGVLVVGPNTVFLRYIEQVLPTLGETASLSSVGGLVPGVRATVEDPIDAARIKGDPRMAKVLERAAKNLEKGLASPATIDFEGQKLVLSVRASRHIVKMIRERVRGKHNEKRPDVRDLTLTYLWNRWKKSQKQWADLFGEDHRESFELDLRENEAFVAALDEMWPVQTAEDVVRTLLTDQKALATAAEGILSKDDQRKVVRELHEGWSEADVALIDEVSPFLGPPARKRKRRPKIDAEERFAIERLVDELQELEPIIRAERQAFIDRLVAQRLELEEEDKTWKRPEREWFGHVVIDEAQTLSPMQWRMIARRCPGKSMTIVGDLGQNVGAWQASSWTDVVDQLAPQKSQLAELSINYRSPAPVAELAARVLAEAAPELAPPRAVRTDGEPPLVVHASDDLVKRTATIAREQASDEGTVAVLADAALVAEIRTELEISLTTDAASLLDAPIAVLTVDDARGLEFDSVVVVEPATIVADAKGGLRALYVAITRATRRLTILHALPLPDVLRS